MIGMKGKEKIKDWMLALVFLLIAILALVIPYNSLFNGQKVFSDYHLINVDAKQGLSYNELGDFIGGLLGTVIAGITCWLVYITYKSQKEELKLARETTEKQQFESTFFNLIRIHKEYLDAMQYSQIYISNPVCDTAENTLIREGLEKKRIKGELSAEEKQKHYSEQMLYGEAALREIFTREIQPNINNCADYLCDFYYTPWFNNICLIFKYINNKRLEIDKSVNQDFDIDFYKKYYSAQITRTEWLLLYGIFLYGEKFASDKDAFKSYVDLSREMRLFDYESGNISAMYQVDSANLYDNPIK